MSWSGVARGFDMLARLASNCDQNKNKRGSEKNIDKAGVTPLAPMPITA
jgi:hypothetical protein